MVQSSDLVSHDKAELLYKITDKSKRGGLRTKNVLLIGYPTIIFCAAKLSLDDQERTRVFILSPETCAEKLEESLLLAVARVGDREAFRQWLDSHPRRRWLKARVQAIWVDSRRSDPRSRGGLQKISNLPQSPCSTPSKGPTKNLSAHQSTRAPEPLASRKAQRPYDSREPRRHKAGFWLYGLVAKPNELGLSPQIYQIHESVIKPLLVQHGMVDRQTILAEYRRLYGRFLADDKLRREILPALEASGLVMQAPNPDDRRKMLVCTPNPPPISNQPSLETIGGTSGVRLPASNAADIRLTQRNGGTPAERREVVA